MFDFICEEVELLQEDLKHVKSVIPEHGRILQRLQGNLLEGLAVSKELGDEEQHENLMEIIQIVRNQ